MIPPLHPRLVKIANLVESSVLMEAITTHHEDPAVREKAAEAKVQLDATIFGAAAFTVNSHEKTASAAHPMQYTAEKLAELAWGVYGMEKMASGEPVENNELLQEATEKLATVGAIEGLLNQLPGELSAEATKLANELRVINRSYGTRILGELIKESAATKLVVVRPREKGSLEQAADKQRDKTRTGGEDES